MKDANELNTLLETETPDMSYIVACVHSNQLETASIAARDHIRNNYLHHQRRRTPTHVTFNNFVRVFSIPATGNIPPPDTEVVHDRLTRAIESCLLFEQKLLPVILSRNWARYRFGTAQSLLQQLRVPFRPGLDALARDLHWILHYHHVGRSAPLCLKTGFKLPVLYIGLYSTHYLPPLIQRYLGLVETSACIRLQRWFKSCRKEENEDGSKKRRVAS